MNWNPYKRPDYKNLSDAELDAATKGYHKKELICLGINLAGALVAGVALCAIFWPAIFPAVPSYIGSFMVAGALFSSTRFSKLGRECRAEANDRYMITLNNTLNAAKQAVQNLAPKPAPPAPAPKPAFNGEAATVLDGDLEVGKPLQFKKKAPGATA